MGSTGLLSGGVGVVLSTLCGGIRVRPYTICATARRPGKANQKEDGARGLVCVYPNAHAGYISWEEYQENQKKLQENATQYRCQRQRTPPREGPALLQGLAICGKCGRRMHVGYHKRRGHSVSGLHLWTLLPLGVENSNASASLGMILTWPLASCCWRPLVR